MGPGEGVVLHAGIDDAPHGRKRREVEFEQTCPYRLARQADVGERDSVAMAIAAGLRGGCEIGLQCLERRPDPGVDPLEPCRLVELELVLEIFAHSRHQLRMRIAGDVLGKVAHPRTRPRSLRWKWRL